MPVGLIRYSPINLGRWLVWGGFALALVIAPLVFSSGSSLSLLSLMGTMMIFSLSYNMLLGQSGMLSFGHAVYSGLGAFFAIHAINLSSSGTLQVPLTLVPLVGGVAGLLFGALFGYVTTQRSGTAFSMISLGIVELVFACSLMFPGFFGGEGGVSGDRVFGRPFFGISFGPQIQVYYLIAFWLFVSAVAMFALAHTPLGRIANAVRDNPERAEFVGYDPQRVRFLMLMLSAFFAGISGGLAAINFEIVSAENVSAARSGAVLLFAFIGGTGIFFGPMLGAIVGVLLTVMLPEFTKAWLLYRDFFHHDGHVRTGRHGQPDRDEPAPGIQGTDAACAACHAAAGRACGHRSDRVRDADRDDVSAVARRGTWHFLEFVRMERRCYVDACLADRDLYAACRRRIFSATTWRVSGCLGGCAGRA